MVHLHVLSCLPLCVFAVMSSAGEHRYESNPLAPADQELQSELRPGTNEVTPPTVLPPHLLRLPMFHQTASFPSKALFRPLAGRRALPSALARILVPREFPSQITVAPVSNNLGVALLCGYGKVLVRVNRVLTGIRGLASDFMLGTCPLSRVDGPNLFFDADLSDCGSSLSIVNNQLVYSNTVVYRPEPQDGMIRAVPLMLPIACVFNRFHYSYKIGFVPQLAAQNFRKILRTQQVFSLSVRNERWEKLTVNESYTLGESMFFEVSADVSNGESVFVEACHATASEDPNSAPRHDVITNFGCLMDSKRTASQSHFILRQLNVLRFSLDAFTFPESTSERFYLHCTVAVKRGSASVTAKSCTFSGLDGRWEELDGDTIVCSCCDSQCEAAGPASPVALVTSEALSLNPSASQMPGDTMLGQVALQGPAGEEEEERVEEGLQEEVVIGCHAVRDGLAVGGGAVDTVKEEMAMDAVAGTNTDGGEANRSRQEPEVKVELPCGSVKDGEPAPGERNVVGTNQMDLTSRTGTTRRP